MSKYLEDDFEHALENLKYYRSKIQNILFDVEISNLSNFEVLNIILDKINKLIEGIKEFKDIAMEEYNDLHNQVNNLLNKI